MVPIDHRLENGNIVEIITSSNSKGPSTDWLKIAKSSHARNKIRSFLKKENKSDNIDKGKELLEKYLRKKGYDPIQVTKNSYINKLIKNLNLTSNEDLYTQLSYGGAFLGRIAITLISYFHEEKQEELKKNENDISNIIVNEKKKKQNNNKNQTGVSVKGVDNLLIRFSKCCNPVPGDEIVGFITKGRGISVHRKDCVNILTMPEIERNRFIEVEWDANEDSKSYNADICILSEDRKGLFSDLSRVCEDMDVHITGVNAKSAKDQIINITMTLSISNTNQMEKVLRSLRSVPGVADVYRAIT